MKYLSPSLWRSDDAARIAEESAKLQNARIIENSLGHRTGWPSMWADEIGIEPRGEQWLATLELAGQAAYMGSIVVFHGTRGSGKTRMAAELALEAGHSRYKTARQLFRDVKHTFHPDSDRSEKSIMDNCIETNLLVVDEYQEGGKSAFESRIITELVDSRMANRRPTIIIANMLRSELSAALGASIIDRMQAKGRSFEFNWPSFRGQNREKL